MSARSAIVAPGSLPAITARTPVPAIDARLEAHLPQPLADELRGLDLPAGELGVLVEVPAPFDHPGVDRRGAAVDLGGEGVGDGRARGSRASRAGGARRRRGRELEREKTGKGKEQGGAVAGRVGHRRRL